ncbi:uncharacterized protein [Nicotiana tomentosiformis]|uniref:uncharacterized protein n=1 Tax=Nicotiana tomentosiformis TaxID=4098 RepID=UPI00388CAE5D
MPKKATTTQKGKSVDDETTSRAPRVTRAQGESHTEIPSQTSHTLPSPEEIRGALAPAPAPVFSFPQPDTSIQEMRDVIQLLTRLVTAQARRQEVGIDHADRAISARVRDFINLEFTGADPNEDPQVFIDRMQRTLRVMKATMIELVELSSYRLRDVVVNWYESWEFSRGENAPPAEWKEFTEAFLRHYLPPELRRARAYTQGVEEHKQKQRADHEHNRGQSKRARYSGPSSEFRCGQRQQYLRYPTHPSASAPLSLPVGYLIVPHIQGPVTVPGPLVLSHIMRDCLTRGGAGIDQPAISVASSSSSVRPPGQGSQAPAGRGRGRSGASSSRGPHNHIYALAGRQDHESSPDVVTGILSVSSYDVYALIDPGSTLSSKMVQFQFLGELILEWKGNTASPRAPLTKLTQKATKFQWTDTYEWSFQALKERLTSTPVLTLPEGIDGYVIYCDTSSVGLGWILMQHGKANVVADALSCRSMNSLSYLQPEKSEIARQLHELANIGVQLLDSGGTGVTIQDTTTSSLVTEVKECQYEDHVLAHYRDTTLQNEKTPYEITRDRFLRYRGRLCIPNVIGLRQQVMGEAH